MEEKRGEAANIVSLEQETQLGVLQSTEESLYTVQSNDIITDVTMTSQRRRRIPLLLGLSTQDTWRNQVALLRTPEPSSYKWRNTHLHTDVITRTGASIMTHHRTNHLTEHVRVLGRGQIDVRCHNGYPRLNWKYLYSCWVKWYD
jgi:hypothetical protein